MVMQDRTTTTPYKGAWGAAHYENGVYVPKAVGTAYAPVPSGTYGAAHYENGVYMPAAVAASPSGGGASSGGGSFGGGGLGPTPMVMNASQQSSNIPASAYYVPDLNPFGQTGPGFAYGNQYLPPDGSSGASGGAGGNFSASTYAPLEALQGRYNKYLDNLEGNSGQIMDQAASRLRDIREGGRKSLMASEGSRGINTSNRLSNYEADTAGSQAKAIADITTNREQTLGNALQGGLGIAQAPANLALSEKGFGLSAAAQQQAAAQQNLQSYLALLNSQRTSPIYTPGAAYGY